MYCRHLLAGVERRICSSTFRTIHIASPCRTSECPPERLMRREGLSVGFWWASKTLQCAIRNLVFATDTTDSRIVFDENIAAFWAKAVRSQVNALENISHRFDFFLKCHFWESPSPSHAPSRVAPHKFTVLFQVRETPAEAPRTKPNRMTT